MRPSYNCLYLGYIEEQIRTRYIGFAPQILGVPRKSSQLLRLFVKIRRAHTTAVTISPVSVYENVVYCIFLAVAVIAYTSERLESEGAR